MSYFITPQGSYYEGDRAHALDIEVFQRPHPKATWNGSEWVRDTVLEAREQIDAEIRAAEAAQDYRTMRAAILGDPVAIAKLRTIEDAIALKRAARPK